MPKITVEIDIPDRLGVHPINEYAEYEKASEEELKKIQEAASNDLYKKVKEKVLIVLKSSSEFDEIFTEGVPAKGCETYEDYGVSLEVR